MDCSPSTSGCTCLRSPSTRAVASRNPGCRNTMLYPGSARRILGRGTGCLVASPVRGGRRRGGPPPPRRGGFPAPGPLSFSRRDSGPVGRRRGSPWGDKPAAHRDGDHSDGAWAKRPRSWAVVPASALGDRDRTSWECGGGSRARGTPGAGGFGGLRGLIPPFLVQMQP